MTRLRVTPRIRAASAAVTSWVLLVEMAPPGSLASIVEVCHHRAASARPSSDHLRWAVRPAADPLQAAEQAGRLLSQ